MTSTRSSGIHPIVHKIKHSLPAVSLSQPIMVVHNDGNKQRPKELDSMMCTQVQTAANMSCKHVLRVPHTSEINHIVFAVCRAV